jgi:hypothetical protein
LHRRFLVPTASITEYAPVVKRVVRITLEGSPLPLVVSI